MSVPRRCIPIEFGSAASRVVQGRPQVVARHGMEIPNHGLGASKFCTRIREPFPPVSHVPQFLQNAECVSVDGEREVVLWVDRQHAR